MGRPMTEGRADAPTPGATARLCASLVDLSATRLPERVVAAAKVVILDGVACLVAGTTEHSSTIVRQYAASVAGPAEASIVGEKRKASAASAAFANGVALHSLDYEPQGAPPAHGTSSILPALLALAERDGIPGYAVVRAFVLGWDVECRLRTAASGVRHAFHPSGIFGPLAATAACAVLLRLSASQTENALGIAASAAGGLAANTPTMTKATHAGNAARIGVEASQLARLGFDAAPGILETRHGIAEAFFESGTAWPSLHDGWGDRYSMADPGVNIKPYPVQYPMLALIEAVLAARPPGFRADALDSAEIFGSEHITSRTDPDPSTGHAGRFSPEYCAAAALVFGAVGLAAFEESARADLALQDVLKRVRLTTRVADHATRHAVSVRVVLRDGKTSTADRAFHRGSIKNPMTRDERLVKVYDCLAHGGREELAEQIVERVERLDSLADLSSLTALLRA